MPLQKRKVEAGKKSEEDFISFARRAASGVAGSVTDAVQRLPMIGSSLSTGISRFAAQKGGAGVLKFIGILTVAIIFGLIAEMVVWRLTGKWREQIRNRSKPESLGEMLKVLFKRFILDIIGLIAFFGCCPHRCPCPDACRRCSAGRIDNDLSDRPAAAGCGVLTHHAGAEPPGTEASAY